MSFRQRQRMLCRWSLVPLVVVLSVAGFGADVPAAEPQKVVLALYGSRPDLPANIIVDEIIRSTLERELDSRLDFYAEFLDTARWPEGEAQIVVHDYLRRKYAQRKLSVIIAVARPAVDFMRIYGDELFPGVPIVAYADADVLRDWEPGRPITGALARVDLSETAKLILSLQPGTREILVISGVSDRDRWLESLARPQLDRLGKRVKLTYIDAESVQDLVKTVARVPDGTVILFLSVYQDSAGNRLLTHEVLARIAKEARVPVYNQSATHVGLGIVGGVVFNPEIIASETAQLTLRLLRGERIQDLPAQESKSTVPMVDWRQMQRWRLDEKRLPAGTVVRFREASVWDSYKWYIVGAVCLLWVQTSLIVGLLWQRATRRKAEASRKESEDRLAGVVGTAMDAIVAIDEKQQIVLFNHAAEKMFGCRRQEVVGTSIERFIPERFRPKHAEHIQSFGRSGVTARLMSTRGVLRAVRTNREEFPIEASISHTESDGKKMFNVIIRDITERLRAEEALSVIGRRLIEAHEEERTWIGRELHDDINQKLAILAIEMERWSQEESRTTSSEHFRRAKKRILDVSMDVQALSHRLHSSKLEYLGLVVAAGSFCKEVSEKAKVDVQFNHSEVPSTMPKEVSLCLFRVLQEALQNAIKYSGVTHFHVFLRRTTDGLELTVSDEGKGFDEHDGLSGQGIGLISMRERLQMVHGVLEIKTQTGAGTTILARVPLQTAELRAIAG